MSDAIVLRPATMADAALLLAWRNDPGTRRASINSEPVPLETHLAWLEAVLASPARSLLIAERDGVPVGTVRLDRAAEGWTELNWTVAPEHRGRGVGTAMVTAAAASRSDPLLAVIRPENMASQAVAAQAGFVRGDSAGGLQRWWRQPAG